MTATRAAVLAATLGLAAASWAIAAWLMHGMDMGIATRPGAFWAFAAAWVTMMAAMMLPGAVPAVDRRARLAGSVRATLPFIAVYLGIWALVGLAAFALDVPHGTLAAGVVVIAAGLYELTPVKRHFRHRCLPDARCGLGYGLCCVGSTAGLMAMLVALDVMSLPWMALIAVIACAQKLLPLRRMVDMPLAAVIIGLGVLLVVAPSLVPGLTPPAMPAM